MTYDNYYRPPPSGHEDNVTLPFKMENLGWIRQYPYSCKANLRLNDEEANTGIIEELKEFKRLGGGTIVDSTILGISRDLAFQKRLATETGVNIISSTGYYDAVSHPSNMDAITEEEIDAMMRNEILVGCEGTDVKCGSIGELGCSWPLQANEKKVLRAAAVTQTQLGCPVIIHPGRGSKAPEEIVRILQEAGGNIGKTVMSHIDRTLHTDEEILEFAKLGTYLEYDLFGIETSNYQCNPTVDMPSDGERIRRIQVLFANGFDKVVIAHDVHTKHRLVRYGGHGFTHILSNVLPQMRRRGVTQEQIDKMLIDNPREWLTFL
ncbi:phosphotriesterase-related protein isoform X2 [Lingula anatina]|nr:phosphotriesterase-related protein isoform X2 [Lingula anatina]|eukprot:XP_013380439.1 phosphotriesterase-related protein isoform X2 [Lingula anatina]